MLSILDLPANLRWLVRQGIIAEPAGFALRSAKTDLRGAFFREEYDVDACRRRQPSPVPAIRRAAGASTSIEEDGVSATIDVLPEIVGAVGGRMPVLVDSGFRHGSAIVKALAIGPRPFVSAAPISGVTRRVRPGRRRRVLGILRFETRLAMQQLGAPSLKDITPDMVRHV